MELPPVLEGLTYAALSVFGLAIGSFFNVLIHRLPRSEEVVRRPSHCPACGESIRWYDNIPVISFVVLGGKCRDCDARISLRYPVVEVLTSVLLVTTYWLSTTAGYTPLASILIAACASILFLIVIIDFETYLIPDQLIWWGLVFSIMLLILGRSPSGGWLGAVIGFFSLSLMLVFIGVIGNRIVYRETYNKEGGFLVVFPWLWYLATFLVLYPVEHLRGGKGESEDEVLDQESATAEKSAMGGGDIKLSAFMGLLLGWKLLIAAFAYALIAGGGIAAIILILKRVTGKYEKGLKLQFGPFLALGCFLALFWGEALIEWYLQFTGLAQR